MPNHQRKQSKHLIDEIDAVLKHRTRWLRRAPLLIALIGVAISGAGLTTGQGWLMSVGALVFIVGLGAQITMWFGLHEGRK